MILDGFVGGLIIAWLLTMFDIDEIILGSIKEIFHKEYSRNVYYLVAGILGAISAILGWRWFN